MKRYNQQLHEEMKIQLRLFLESEGFEFIKTDLEGETRPKFIGGFSIDYVPDLTAMKDGVFHVFEIETDDSLTHEHTTKQWQAFDRYCRQKSNRRFIVLVETKENEARQHAEELGVQPAVWTVASVSDSIFQD